MITTAYQSGLPNLLSSLCHETSTLYYLSHPPQGANETLEDRSIGLIVEFNSECLGEDFFLRLRELKGEIKEKVHAMDAQYVLSEGQREIYNELSPTRGEELAAITVSRQKMYKQEMKQRKSDLERLYQILSTID